MQVDVNHLIVVRMWKGYRDAQCAFIKRRPRSTAPASLVASSTPSASAPAAAVAKRGGSLLADKPASSSVAAAAPAASGGRANAARLYMVLYAPWRGLLELWELPYGQRFPFLFFLCAALLV